MKFVLKRNGLRNGKEKRRNKGVDQLGGVETRVLAHVALSVVERTLAAVLHIPDAQLCVEIPKPADDLQLDAAGGRSCLQRKKRLDHVAMHSGAKILALHDVSAGFSGQFE